MGQSEIEVRFERLVMISEKLQEISDQMKRLVDDTGMGIVQKTKEFWISENADLLIQKELKSIRRIDESAQNLKGLSQELYEKAKKLYELEMQNVIIATRRQY